MGCSISSGAPLLPKGPHPYPFMLTIGGKGYYPQDLWVWDMTPTSENSVYYLKQQNPRKKKPVDHKTPS